MDQSQCAARSVGARSFVIIDEGNEGVAGDAGGIRRPVASAVESFDGRQVFFPPKRGGLFAHEFQIVEELQEHDPCEHRQPVEVAAQSFIFSHDLAGRFDDRPKLLRGGESG